jgi:hypothetical protein
MKRANTVQNGLSGNTELSPKNCYFSESNRFDTDPTSASKISLPCTRTACRLLNFHPKSDDFSLKPDIVSLNPLHKQQRKTLPSQVHPGDKPFALLRSIIKTSIAVAFDRNYPQRSGL